MKILMLTDKMELGGAETHIYALSKCLIERGHRLTLMSGGGAFAERLGRLGAELITAPLDKRDLISVIKSIKAIRLAMRQCHIVHAHTRFTSTVARLVRGGAVFPRIVTTAHLPFPRRSLGKFTKWGDITLAVSEDIKRHLISDYGIAEDKILPTRNGIDLTEFSGPLYPEELILHISRIDRGRSRTAFMLCELAQKIYSTLKLKLLIVGDGNDFARLQAICEAINRGAGEEIIILAGAVAEVAPMLRRAKIFIGVSRALLEAMAMGIPSIASGDEGYGGIITEDSIRRLRDTNFCARGMGYATKERLFSDIVRLVSSPEDMKKSGECGRNTVLKEYSQDIFTDQAITAYKKAKVTPRIALLGYFGFSNLGDEETLKISTKKLTRPRSSAINILTSKGNEYGNGISAYKRSSPIQIIKCLSRSDILILPGGNLIQNETSNRSLLYYSSVILLARLMKRRIMLLSSGIGELRGRTADMLAAFCLRSCDFIGGRTRADLAVMKQYKPYVKPRLMPDLCFLKKGRVKAGEACYLTVITANGYIPSAEVISAVESNTGLAVRLCSIANDIPKEFNKSTPQILLLSSFEELEELISSSAFVISYRLHGAIFSMLCGIPCLLSCHNSKNRALIDEIEHRCKRADLLAPLFPFYHRDLVLIGNWYSMPPELQFAEEIDEFKSRKEQKADASQPSATRAEALLDRLCRLAKSDTVCGAPRFSAEIIKSLRRDIEGALRDCFGEM